MLTLDDLLGCFGHSVELDVLGSFLEIFDLKLHALVDGLDDLQLCLVVEDLLHVVHLLVASGLDL